jgi:hypothetical protein
LHDKEAAAAVSQAELNSKKDLKKTEIVNNNMNNNKNNNYKPNFQRKTMNNIQPSQNS